VLQGTPALGVSVTCGGRLPLGVRRA
jgi:hypothetical protein